MSWETVVNFTGQTVAGVRQGQPPRGLFRVKVGASSLEHPKDKKTGAPDANRKMILLPITIVKAFACKAVPAQEQAVSMAASIYINLPDGVEPAAATRNEKGLKRALVVISGLEKARAEALAKSQKLSNTAFDGKEFAAWHEPSAEENGLGNWTILSEEEAQKVAAGTMTIAAATKKPDAASGSARNATGGTATGANGTQTQVDGFDLDDAPSLGTGATAPAPDDDALFS